MEGDHIHFATGELFPVISIHSLRMEGDQRLGKSPEPRNISIHSLRMEGDYIDLGYLCGGVYFNPLPPHGGRQDKLPVEANFENISIHSLRMEGDTLIWLTEILQ